MSSKGWPQLAVAGAEPERTRQCLSYADIPPSLRRDFKPDQLQMYYSCFKIYDLNNDGLIDAKELSDVSHRLGYRMTNDRIAELLHDRDTNEDGLLNFEEFVRAMPGNTDDIPEEEHRLAEFRQKFMDFDLDGSGSVSVEEAHTILAKELAFTPRQSERLFAFYDKNNDGRLSYDEFVYFYRKISSRIEGIKAMFQQFDRDNSGAISVRECKRMIKKLDLPDRGIEQLVERHDKSGDGELQFEEFVSFLMEDENLQMLVK